MGYTKEGVGYQGGDTSLQAAQSNVGKKLTLREQVKNVLCGTSKALSTEQIAEMLGRPYVSVQPRLSELANDGLIRDSGKRGKTQWGKQCILWEAL